ncbi:peptidoglycan DD-metalloendopeptidase family protein [Desulfocicer niacini]
MRYPYIDYCYQVKICPIFKDLIGDPLVLDLGAGAPVYDKVDLKDQKVFQQWLDTAMAQQGASWGVASYLENREPLLDGYPQMREEQRYYHLGLDIIVDLDTPLHAPLDATVVHSEYEEGPGNYGGNVLLRHDGDGFETFYSLYGHLNRKQLPSVGEAIGAGEAFAVIGDFYENGNWFYHTHLQVITQKGYEQGWVSKGYCTAGDLAVMDGICPSPLSLFKL